MCLCDLLKIMSPNFNKLWTDIGQNLVDVKYVTIAQLDKIRKKFGKITEKLGKSETSKVTMATNNYML